MEVTLFQTSDAFKYYDMLQVTAQTTRAFCRNMGVRYECFVGLRRGDKNWHSTYNRVVYLADRVREGYGGWILHFDADAFVQDTHFDIREYLHDKHQYAMIGAPSGASYPFWDMNIGIMFFNLGHPFMRELIGDWYAYLSRFDLARDAPGWSENISDDQAMFHELLMRTPERKDDIYYETWDFMNSPVASFARQIMRFPGITFEQRLEDVRQRCEAVMAGETAPDLDL